MHEYHRLDHLGLNCRRGRRSSHTGHRIGVIGDIILGILGALVGGWITRALLGVHVSGFNLESLFVAVFGAIVIIVIGRLISGRSVAV